MLKAGHADCFRFSGNLFLQNIRPFAPKQAMFCLRTRHVFRANYGLQAANYGLQRANYGLGLEIIAFGMESSDFFVCLHAYDT